MGTGGDITMTNLKSATGIVDDRLSAHHPNGTGNQTPFGDFLIDEIGNATQGTTLNRDGGHTLHPPDSDNGVSGEILNVILEVFTTPEGTNDNFWPVQIAPQGLVVDQATSSNLSLIEFTIIDATTNAQITMHARFRHTSTGSVDAVLRMEDGLNTDIPNYNVQLSTGTITNAVTSSDVPALLDSSFNEVSSSTIDFTIQAYDPESTISGDTYIEWVLANDSNTSPGFEGDQGSVSTATTPVTVTANHSFSSGTAVDLIMDLYESSSKNTKYDSATLDFLIGDGSGGESLVPWDPAVNG